MDTSPAASVSHSKELPLPIYHADERISQRVTDISQTSGLGALIIYPDRYNFYRHVSEILTRLTTCAQGREKVNCTPTLATNTPGAEVSVSRITRIREGELHMIERTAL